MKVPRAITTNYGYGCVVDDQHAVIKSSDIAFDKNAFALPLTQRQVKRGFNLVIGS